MGAFIFYFLKKREYMQRMIFYTAYILNFMSFIPNLFRVRSNIICKSHLKLSSCWLYVLSIFYKRLAALTCATMHCFQVVRRSNKQLAAILIILPLFQRSKIICSMGRKAVRNFERVKNIEMTYEGKSTAEIAKILARDHRSIMKSI